MHIPETLDLQSHWSHAGIELLLHGPKQKSTYSVEAITVTAVLLQNHPESTDSADIP